MRLSSSLKILIACLVVFPATLFADEVDYVISGVDEPMLTNVRHHVSAFRIGHGAKLNSRLRRSLLREAEAATIDAVRPFGYFHPRITIDIQSKSAGNWVVSIDVDPGPPVLVKVLKLEVIGPGQELELIKDWYKTFPLAEGKVLNQPAWDKAKLEVVESLEEVGYLQTEFNRHIMRVDTVANTASLELVLDTGPQAVMGTVTFNQDVLNDGVLGRLQRFEPGVAYSTWLMEKFRLDLWRIGYFEDIEVIERRVLTAEPPRVDLEVNATPREKNTYQGTLGFGTDTLTRFQFLWGRHLLSPRGDNFDIGFGWQQRHNEFTFQTNYRLPRETKSHQFWIASFVAKSENQSLKVSESGNIDDRTTIASGRINDYSLKLGKTRVRNMRAGFRQLFETIYVQYLNENRDFSLTRNEELETGLLEDRIRSTNFSSGPLPPWRLEWSGTGRRFAVPDLRPWVTMSVPGYLPPMIHWGPMSASARFMHPHGSIFWPETAGNSYCGPRRVTAMPEPVQ
jgi:translocation and assembly module TamA